MLRRFRNEEIKTFFLFFAFIFLFILAGCSFDAKKGTIGFHFKAEKHFGSGIFSKSKKSPLNSAGDTFELEVGKGEKLHIDCNSSSTRKTMSIKFIDDNGKVIYEIPINKHVKKDVVITEAGKYYFVVKGRGTWDSFTIKWQFK